MKKIILTGFFLAICVFAGDTLSAQARSSIVNGYAAEFYAGGRLESATPANVLKWCRELKLELDKIAPKLAKISSQKPKDVETKALITQARTICNQVIAKGSKLTMAEAKKHDKWFWNGMFKLVGDCLETNPGSECCFSCTGGGAGYGDFWCKANCFVWRFPGLD